MNVLELDLESPKQRWALDKAPFKYEDRQSLHSPPRESVLQPVASIALLLIPSKGSGSEPQWQFCS